MAGEVAGFLPLFSHTALSGGKDQHVQRPRHVPTVSERSAAGTVPRLPIIPPQITGSQAATEDPTRSFPGREGIETARQLTLEGLGRPLVVTRKAQPCLASKSDL